MTQSRDGNAQASNLVANSNLTTPHPNGGPGGGGGGNGPGGIGGETWVPPQSGPSVTDTVAAVTIAVLACVLLLTLVLICRAIHKRRQQQRGQRLTHIPTISTGIMGTGVAAYRNVRIPHVEGSISWERVTASTSATTASTSATASASASSATQPSTSFAQPSTSSALH